MLALAGDVSGPSGEVCAPVSRISGPEDRVRRDSPGSRDREGHVAAVIARSRATSGAVHGPEDGMSEREAAVAAPSGVVCGPEDGVSRWEARFIAPAGEASRPSTAVNVRKGRFRTADGEVSRPLDASPARETGVTDPAGAALGPSGRVLAYFTTLPIVSWCVAMWVRIVGPMAALFANPAFCAAASPAAGENDETSA